MEWLVLAALAALAAIYIALPRREDAQPDREAGATADDLRAQRDELVAALRDLDDDVAAGRMTAEDRRRGRQEIGEHLRDVMELLRAQETRP
ncbi:MAG: hypothetical protein WC273_04220 [Dehalococcoidia bacterium]